MLKNLLFAFAILSIHLPSFAARPLNSSDRVKSANYAALSSIISAETPPPVSKNQAADDLKSRPHEVLAELCFFAGALQMKLAKLSTINPYILQLPEPSRTQVQTLVGAGQDVLRKSCEMNEANSKLSVRDRVTAVQSAISDVQSEAVRLRSSLGNTAK